MSAVSAIEYFHYNNTLTGNFFSQKQKQILSAMQQKISRIQTTKLNSLISQAELNLNQMITNTSVSKEELKKAIEISLNKTTDLGQSLEAMSQNISGYVQQKSNLINPLAQQLQQTYSQGYGQFYNLIQQVRAKGGTLMDTTFLNSVLQKVNPQVLSNGVAQIGTQLGDIGEVVGQVLLKRIGDELLNTTFKNIPNVSATVENTGNQKVGSVKIYTATSDNVLVIRGNNNQILFQLNLSNKLNTKFSQGAKSTGRMVKIASKSVGEFLKEQSSDQKEWEIAVYNTFSYHWDSAKKKRKDYYQTAAGSLMRQTIGMELLYDHVYGTGNELISQGQYIPDTVYLMAYGNKIFASEDVLKVALSKYAHKQKFNMARVLMNRAEWFNPSGLWERGKTSDMIQNEYDVQKKIAKFNLTYMQNIYFA